MQPEYYYKNLYPLQDRVLRAMAEVDTSLYLTGGTALSRCYLNHRFSDDLDFFANRDPDFRKKTELVIAHLQAQPEFLIEIEQRDKDYLRCFAVAGDTRLKLDFVNDVTYRYGQSQAHSIFSRVDNLRNILSNKISALSRNSAKDFVDILYICRVLSFLWREIVHEASEKDLWVNPIEISRLIDEFDAKRLGEIPWIIPVDVEAFQQAQHKIARDILLGLENRPS